MECDWSITSLDEHDGVALVTVDLRNPSPVDRRVRVSNRLDGPVLPPRRAGVSDPGWDEDGFDGVVPAEGRRALGYACPASPDRPPVTVTDAGRADERASDAAAVAVRELGDPRPPSDAIPTAAGDVDTDADADGNVADDPEGPTDGAEVGDVPPAVDSWLAAVAERIERGERLTDASVESATEALDADGMDVPELSRRVSDDAAALRAVAERAATLADRAAAVDVPIEALRRLQ